MLGRSWLAGVVASGSTESSLHFCRISGERMIFCNSAPSFATIGAGVAAGTRMPFHDPAS